MNTYSGKIDEWTFPDLNKPVQEKKEIPVVVDINKELEPLKNELKKRIELTDTLLKKLTEPLNSIDNTLIEYLLTIIKKSIKQIIHKEIAIDDQLIIKMIEELKESIHANNGMVTIHLSENDFNSFKNIENINSINFKVNMTLKSGDIIIKSNTNEIHALLEQRINQVLGIHYA